MKFYAGGNSIPERVRIAVSDLDTDVLSVSKFLI